MAEVLGVAASVAGLISLADIVVERGYKFLRTIKNAEKTVKSLVHEVNVLSGVLHSLSNTIQLLEEDEDSANFDPTTQVHYIEACYQTLLQIQCSLEAALPSTPLSIGQKIRWPLRQSETKELLADMQRHKSTMVLAMSATEMSTVLKVLTRQDAIQDGIRGLKSHLESDREERKHIIIGEERLQMLNFLSNIEAQKWQDSNIRLRQPGTGIWFTDGPEFKTWRSEANTKLWINGIPGAGKTILVSSIIQEVEKLMDSQNALAFFYCDYKDANTHNPLCILGSLARQLIAQNEECFEYLSTFYRDHFTKDRQIRASTSEELCDLIVKVSAQFQNTMIVVDGLDEISEDRADITRFLRGLNDHSRSVKTLFASRPEVDIGHVLEDFEKISIAAMSSDLCLYVGSEIERRTKSRKLNITDRDLKEHIMKTLIEGADGINVLYWIGYAEESYPLTTTQLLQALAVQSGDTVFDSSGMTTEDELLHWCSSLVRRNRSSTGLEFAHFTVKEFLISIDPILKPQYIDYRLSGDHSLLAEACVTFLSFTSFDDQPISSLDPVSLLPTECYLEEVWKPFRDKCAFFEYAAINWALHLRRSKSDSIHETVDQLFNPERSSTFRLWTLTWFQSHYGIGADEPELYTNIDSDPTPLHWAACFALNDVCVTLIKLGMDVEKTSKFGKPLNCALKLARAWYPDDDGWNFWAQSGQKETIQALLNAGANARAQVDIDGRRTAFQLALEADIQMYEPFAATKIMLDSGCTILSEDFDVILKKPDDLFEANGALLEGAMSIVETFASAFPIYLDPSVHLEFFSFALQMLSLGCEGKYLSSLFNITPPEAFPVVVHQELNRSVRSSKTDISLQALIQLLYQFIRKISDNPETTRTIFQGALTLAIKYNNYEVAQELLAMNEHWDGLFAIGGTTDLCSVLIEAAIADDADAEGWDAVIESLVIQGVNVTAPDVSGFSPLEMCVVKDWNLDTFRLLWNSTQAAQYYASLDNKYLLADMTRLLYFAVDSTSLEVAKFIVRKLSDKGIISEAQWLELAIVKNASIIWDALALQGRGFSNLELDRQFALHVAARPHISSKGYKFILDKGASMSLQYPNGNIPLHDLTQTHEDVSLEKIKLTLEAALNLDIINCQNFTPLALAIRCKNTPATQLLLEAGANPDIPLSGQQTALHLACWVGNTDGAKLLLKHGCNPSHQDSRGQTPKDVALTCSYTILADMIQNAIDERSRVSSENTNDVEMWSTPMDDLHGNLPLRMAEGIELPSVVISSSGSSLKRGSSDMGLGSSGIKMGKKLRAAC
ncbi:Ankyrin repeat and protein kinase domain-containing protein [Lachnellula hyalina]|uniref:Ankyrin repeat and protein kinase domain-containing protein n=1 Tax=Lachnellula hyalina TaxID=1316788 RepID=A0A8H8QVK8_9HELO|nr:Ankyrin repeat and protein kinase domain-containing protein [Lachnellula hyalina]TVY23573.1 Ankyrin repeat and protein kinase domain-containing protein [Lachnellula hyalina]